MDLDQRTIKLSNERLVVSGHMVEWYRYEKPYMFNFPVDPKDRAGKRDKTRPRREDNLFRTRTTIRRVVEANVRGDCMPKFVTYTFAENVTDYKKAADKWRTYIERLNRAFGKQSYLVVCEFQERGAVHYHAIHFSLPFIPRAKHRIAELWGDGFIKIKAIKKVRSVGAYVSKYLQKENYDLRLAGKKAFFTSNGLKRPYEIRQVIHIDAFLTACTLVEDAQREYYSSRLGRVLYTRLKKAKQ